MPLVPEHRLEVRVVARSVEPRRVLTEHVGVEVREDTDLIRAADDSSDARDVGVAKGVHHVFCACFGVVVQPLG
jgi:hypothetical protein